MKICLFLLTSFLLFSAMILPSKARTWTGNNGKNLEGEILDFKDGKVRLKTPKGEFNVPLSKFSQADQEFAKKWLERQQSAGTAKKSNNKTRKQAPGIGPVVVASTGFDQPWPSSCKVDSQFDIETIKEDKDARKFVYQSPHYEFIADERLSKSVVKEFSRIFEATLTGITSLPLNLNVVMPKESSHFVCRLFVNEADYYKQGGPPGSAGVFIGRTREIMIPLANLGVKQTGGGRFIVDHKAENTTLIHEITHQAMHQYLRSMPIWFTEGIAEYMASAKYNSGRFGFTNHKKATLEYIKERKGVWGKDFQMLHLEKFMKLDQAGFLAGTGTTKGTVHNYAAAALLTDYFFHHDGDEDAARVKAYVEALQKGEKEVKARELLLDGRSYEELEKAFLKTWRSSLKIQLTD